MISDYTFKARNLEREFQRKVRKLGFFKTVTGKVNRIIDYSKYHITFKNEASGVEHRLSRKKLREAMSFAFFKKTVTRKELEPYSNFNSVLLGILFKVFEDICKVQRLRNGLLRLTIKGVRWFFSGVTRSPRDIEMIKREGGHFVLLSYAHIRQDRGKNFLRYLEEYNLYCIIDSGAWTMYGKEQGKAKEDLTQLSFFDANSITVEEYINFINRYKDHKRIMGFFNLDVIGDPVQTKKNYHLLKEHTHAEIIPVWQIGDRFERLDEYVNDDPLLIGIGAMVPLLKSVKKEKVRSRLKEVFDRFPDMNYHAFGIANELLHQFDFFSSDSTAWVNARKNGSRYLLWPNGEKIIAPAGTSLSYILANHIRYFANLEEQRQTEQYSLPI